MKAIRVHRTAASTRRARVLAGAALAILGLFLAPSASASVECSYSSSTRLLSVTASERAFEEGEGVIRRVGESIQVSKLFGGKVSCGDTPTVTNTDRIELLTKGLGGIDIALEGGPFAPGATPEADASSEIELTVAGSGIVELVGGRGPDHFRYETDTEGSGLNLNPGPDDRDVDVGLPELEESEALFVANGGKGRDTIDVVDRPQVDVFAVGGDGNDLLIARDASSFGAILTGGKGRDRLVGGAGFDLIFPGAGADTIKALGGPDEIDTAPDKRRDRIDCGAGPDRVGRSDPFDRLRSCERVRRGKGR